MSNSLRTELLREISEQQQARLSERSALKQEVLGRNSALPPVRKNFVETVPGDELGRYSSMEEYTKAGNPWSYEADKYFRTSQLERASANLRRELDKTEERNTNAWAKDDELGSLVGEAKQLAANATVSVANAAGDAAGMPAVLAGMQMGSLVDRKARDIHARELQAKALQADERDLLYRETMGRVGPMEATIERANRQQFKDALVPVTDEERAYLEQVPEAAQHATAAIGAGIEGPGSAMAQALPQITQDMTRRQLLDSLRDATASSQASRDMFRTMVDGIANDKRQQAQGEDIAKSSDVANAKISLGAQAWKEGNKGEALGQFTSAAAGLLADMPGHILSHPAATFDWLMQNSADFTLGAVSTPALLQRNVAYGLQIYNDAIADYRAKNNGATPSREVAAEKLGWALAAVAADQAGEVFSLKGLGLLGKGTTGALEAGAAEGMQAALAQASKPFLKRVAASANETGTKAARAGGVEALTEGFQTAVEDTFSKGGGLEDVDVGKVYEGATIGMGVGGSLAGGIEAAQQTKEGRANNLVRHLDTKAKKAAKQQEFDEAVASGDVSTYANPKKKESFDPGKAVEALQLKSQAEGTSVSEKAKLRQKAEKLVETMEVRNERLAHRLKLATPEGRAEAEQELEAEQKELAELQAVQKPTREQKEDIAYLTHRTNYTKKVMAEIDALTEEQRAQEIEDAREFQKTTQIARDRIRQWDASITPKERTELQEIDTAEVDSAVSTLASTDTTPEAVTQREAAAEHIVTLAMQNPAALSQQHLATALKSKALTEPQRELLRKLSTARQAENALKTDNDVAVDIIDGNPEQKYKGLRQYEADFDKAMRSNDVDEAGNALARLGNWVREHQQKTRAVTEARKKARSTDTTVFLSMEKKTKQWVEVPPMTIEEARQTGSLDIGRGSPLPESLQKETAALVAGAKAMHARFQMQFKEAPIKKTGNVRKDARKAKSAEPEKPAEVKKPAEAVTEEGVEDAPEEITKEVTAEETKEVTEEGTKEEPEEETEESTEATYTETLSEEGTSEEDANAAKEPKAPQGRLSVFERQEEQRVKPEDWKASLYTSVNHLVQFFKQSPGKEGATSLRPLVMVKDFVSKVRTKQVRMSDFLDQDPALTDEQKAIQHQALMAFFRQNDAWNKVVDALTYQKTDEKQRLYLYRDVLQYYINPETGKFDENLKTAVSMALFTYLVESARAPLTNDDDTIRKQLGKQDTARVTDFDRKELGHVGTREALLAMSLGQKVYQALGLRPYDTHTPINEPNKHQLALGQLVIELAVREGLLIENSIPSYKMDMLRAEPRDRWGILEEHRSRVIETNQKLRAEKKQPITLETGKKERFLQRATETKQMADGRKFTGVVAAIDAMFESQLMSQSVLTKLFGVEDGLEAPVFTEPEFTDKKVRHTERPVASVQAQRVNALGKHPHNLRLDMWSVYQALPQRLAHAFAGVIPEDETPIHVVHARKRTAQNEDLILQLQRLTDFVDMVGAQPEKLTTDFFFQHFVGKPQRVFQRGNLVNRQLSKIHRHFISIKGSEATIKTNDTEAVDRFLVVIAQGFDSIDTDKQADAKSLPEVRALLETPHIKTAVQALREVIYQGQPLSREGERALEQAVEFGKKHYHTLDALVALATYEEARATEAEEFTVHLMGEIDGVSNGPILSQVLLGTLSDDMAAQGGFFLLGSEDRDYSVWRGKPGNKDLYTSVMETMVEKLQGLAGDPKSAPVLKAIYGIGGDLMGKAARMLIKEAVLPLSFGSNVKNVSANMAGKFVDKFYASIEQAFTNLDDESELQEGAQIQARLDALVADANVMIADFNDMQDMIEDPKKRKPKVEPLPQLPVSAALTSEITQDVVDALEAVYEVYIGKALTHALETHFRTFLSRRVFFNQAANLVFGIYNSLREMYKDQLFYELIYSGQMAVRHDKEGKIIVDKKTGKPIPLHDLTEEQEAELNRRLRKVNPLLDTPMAKLSKQRDAGLLLSKDEQQLSDDFRYGQESTFASRDGQHKTGTRRTTGMMKALQEPGVAALILAIHSSDSAIASAAYAELKALNLHDALGIGLDDMIKAGNLLNMHTFDVLQNYSPSLAMADTLVNQIRGLHTALTQAAEADDRRLGTLISQVLGQKNWEDEPMGPASLGEFVRAFLSTALQTEIDKQDLLSRTAYLSQYAFEGSAYQVTDEDRARAASRKADLEASGDGVTQALARELDEIVNMITEAASRPETMHSFSQAASQDTEVTDEANAQQERQAAWDKHHRDAHLTVLNAIVTQSKASDSIKQTAKQLLDTMKKTRKGLLHSAKTLFDDAGVRKVVAMVEKLRKQQKIAALGETTVHASTSDPVLVQYFAEQKGPVNGKAFAQRLLTRLKAQETKAGTERNKAAWQVRIHRQVLEQLLKNVPENLTIHYVTPDTPAEELYGDQEAVKTANGWYVTGAEPKIFIRSPDFAMSGVTSELLVHELLHSVTHIVLAEAQRKKTHPARSAIERLETVRTLVTEYLKANGLEAQYAEHVSSLDEFLTYGMTNPDFMQLLNKIPAPRLQPAKTSKLYKAAQAFLEGLASLVFGKHHVESGLQTALGAVLSNGAIVLAAAEQAQGARIAAAETTLAMQHQRSPNELDTEDLFDAIGQQAAHVVDPFFKQHLQDVLAEIVNKIRGPFEIFHKLQTLAPNMDPVAEYLTTLTTGQRPFTSEALQHFSLAPQAAFVLEQVELILTEVQKKSAAFKNTYAIRKELRRIWQEARTRIEPKDLYEALTGNTWATATIQEQQQAQAQHAFLFSAQQDAEGNLVSPTRFAALLLTIPQLASLAGYNSYRAGRSWRDMNWMERARAIFSRALGLLSGPVLRGYEGRTAFTQVQTLVNALVRIENQHRVALARTDDGAFSRFENGVKVLRDRVQQRSATQADRMKNSTWAPVRAMGVVTEVVAKKRVDALYQNFLDMRSKRKQEAPNAVLGVLDEVRGVPAKILELILVAKHNEQTRKHLKDGMAKNLLASFRDQGTHLTPEQRAALTQVLLRSGAHALLDTYPMARLQQMLASPAVLEQEIRALEAQIPAGPARLYYLAQAKFTGLYLATNEVETPHLYRNAYQLARAWGHSSSQQITETDARTVEPVLDRLITLYALTHQPNQARRVAHVLQDERERADQGNGVEVLLRFHKQMETEALERLFEGNPAMMQKGYVPEVYDAHTEIRVVGEIAGKRLEAEGWERVTEGLPTDPHDLTLGKQYMYRLKYRGLRHYVTGGVSLTSRHAKGTTKHTGQWSVFDGQAHNYNRQLTLNMVRLRKKSIEALGTLPPSFRPGKVAQRQRSYQVPVFNPQGQIVNYAYHMSATVRDELLGRDNDFSTVMGALSASIFDKESAPIQNRTVVQALVDQHRAEGAKRPGMFLELSAETRDPKLRNLWFLLPEDMRQAAHEITGYRRLYVRSDLLYPVFGYRTPTLTAMFDKVSPTALTGHADLHNVREADSEIRNFAEELVVTYLERLFGKTVGLRLRQAEDVMAEAVTLTKDILVIRTGFVLAGNIISNLHQLWWAGVPLKDMFQHSRTAFIGAMDFRQNEARLQHLYLLRDSRSQGHVLGDIEREIAALEDAQAINPVRPLIDAGLLPTIVDDVSTEDEADTYLNRLQTWAKPVTDIVPSPIRTGLRTVVVGHGTPLYKILSQGTQISDFMARYALYQHLTTRSQEPLSHEQAVVRAAEDFVNYDIPSHPGMHFLNRLGLVYFTKYYLRIQRVLLRNFEERPARAMLLLLQQHYFDGVQQIMDSLPTFNNPLEPGALKLGEVWDDSLILRTLFSWVR